MKKSVKCLNRKSNKNKPRENKKKMTLDYF